MLTQSIVVLDFETTGLHADLGDRVTEVAALRVQHGKIIERYESLVNCGMRIPRHIAKFTHITQDMVDSAPAPERVFAELLQFIGSDWVIAHNAAFDQGFLECECRRLGLVMGGNDFICSVKIARQLFPELRSHALGPLACSLGLQSTANAHRAGADAEVTAAVFLRLTEIIRARYGFACCNVEMLTQVMTKPIASAA